MIQKYIVGIDHIAFQVPNLEAELDFFHKLLGFKIVREIKYKDNQIVMLKAGKIEIEMWQNKENEAPSLENGDRVVHHLAVQVKNIDTVIEHMKAIGIEIQTDIYEPTQGIREAIVLGPGSVRVQFVEQNIPLLIWRSMTGYFEKKRTRRKSDCMKNDPKSLPIL